ncbi:MAG: LytR C-terminal domain-containing protein [Microthrixaceae bacterium]
MASPQRSKQRRSGPSGPDPAARGIILVVVAVVLGAILLAAGGTVGFDQDDASVDIGEGGGDGVTETTAPVEEETTTSAPVTVAPSEVAVVAANGAGISGLAGETATFLATQGYNNTSATDAVTDTAQTVVYYVDGFQPNAAAIAATLGIPASQVQPLPAEPVASEQPDGTAVVVVIGPDAQAVVTGAAATDTTAPG